ncbi:hypothetical protein BBJ28_00008390 [Nothophytophthora sp. Chile5]|nr:hypothetical protein BBJ28_00008390 [Nothophytophthora sp. Chile5]
MSPRSCYDCLNVAIPDDSVRSCALGPLGQCASISQLGSAIRSHSYAASDFTYCESDDAICSDCDAAWAREYQELGHVTNDSVCQGSNDCLCLSSCSNPARMEKVIAAYCSDMDPSVGRAVTFIGVGIATCLLFVAMSFGVRFLIKYIDPNNEIPRTPTGRYDHHQRLERPPPGEMQLGLSAWTSMRDKLIETEKGGRSEDRKVELALPQGPTA